MKGLLLKDWYVLWGGAKRLLFLIALYIVIGEFSAGIGSVGVLLCAMLPTSCMAYDERAKWDRYALSMPVSVKDLVVSKYLLGYLALLVGAALKLLVMLLPFGKGGDFASLALLLAATLLYIAVQFPILFKFGIESGRIWMMLLTAAFAIGVVTLGTAASLDVDLSKLPYLALATAIILQIPSIYLAVKFRAKRA